MPLQSTTCTRKRSCRWTLTLDYPWSNFVYMHNAISFADVQGAAGRLMLSEQEYLIDVLHRRIVGQRRAELITDIRDVDRDFQADECRPTSYSGLLMLHAA